MNFAPSFYRKVVYALLAAGLLLPISFLARPNRVNSDPNQAGTVSGGMISEMRSKHNLSQASLSQIDPTSEVMKLASLGLHGIAVNVLWNQANEYQEKKAFDKVSSTVETLILLQPNFVSVWEFQGHNLAYNISREFDDYQDRYFWVKEGLNFFMNGIAFNKRDHRIYDNLGLHTGIKLGNSDEKRQFRKIFRQDRDYMDTQVSDYLEPEDFERSEAGGYDPWLMSYWWYDKSYHMREKLNAPKKTSDIMYWMKGPAQLRNYAEAISEDFRPGEASRRAWQDAFLAWTDRDPISERIGYGKREIQTSFGTIIRYEDLDRERERMLSISRQMDELAPGVRDELRRKRIEALSEDDQRILNMPEDQRRFKDIIELQRIIPLVTVYESEVEERVPEETKAKARNLMRELADGEYRMKQMENYRTTVNYPFWRERNAMEGTLPGVSARQAYFDAQQEAQKGNLEAYEVEEADEQGNLVLVRKEGAIELLEQGFAYFSEALQPFDHLKDGESTMIDDVLQDITKYSSYLTIVGREWPDDFPLQWLIDERVRRYGRTNVKNLLTTEEIMARKRERGLLEEPKSEAPEQSPPTQEEPPKQEAPPTAAGNTAEQGAGEDDKQEQTAGDAGQTAEAAESGSGETAGNE
jgi:hypothetical protein